MVDIVSAAPAAPLHITVRPNCALRRREGLLTLALVLPVATAIAIGFSRLGAWPVVPY